MKEENASPAGTLRPAKNRSSSEASGGLRYDAFLLLTTVIWGVNFSVVKGALDSMEIHVFNALRFSISVLLLGSVELARTVRGARLPRLPRRFILLLLLAGLIGHGAYQVTFIEGMSRTSAGSAALLIASTPLWTAIISSLLRIEMLSGGAWFGLGVTLLGTILVALAGGREIEPSVSLGNILILVAALCWATSTVLSKPLLQRMAATRVTFLGMLVAVPILWTIAGPANVLRDLPAIDLSLWAAIVYSGAMSTGIAYLLWNLGVKHIGPSHSAAYGNLVPVVALLAAYLMLGESILPGQIMGGALVIGGLLLVRRTRRRRIPLRQHP